MPAPNNVSLPGRNSVGQIPPSPVWGGPVQQPSTTTPPEDKPESQPERKPVHPTIPALVWCALCMKISGQVEPPPEKENSNLQHHLGFSRPGTAEYHALQGDKGAADQLMETALQFCGDLASKEHREKQKVQQAAFSQFTIEFMNQLIEKEKSNHSEFIEKSKEHRKYFEEMSEESPEYVKREEILEELDRSVDEETALLEGITFQSTRLRKDIIAAAKKRRIRGA